MRSAGNLKALRKSRGWTQAHVAVLAGIGIGDVSRLENGLLKPSKRQTEKLSHLFGVPADELFGEEKLMT